MWRFRTLPIKKQPTAFSYKKKKKTSNTYSIYLHRLNNPRKDTVVYSERGRKEGRDREREFSDRKLCYFTYHTTFTSRYNSTKKGLEHNVLNLSLNLLSHKDSNLVRQNQKLQCYRYTMRQSLYALFL